MEAAACDYEKLNELVGQRRPPQRSWTPCTKGGSSSVKRQRAKQRPLYRYDVYRGRRKV